MIQNYILTLIGDDRPGLVDSLAEVVHRHQGNWEESRLANLRGKFSGIVLVSIPSSNETAFETDVEALKDSGLSVRATRAEAIQQQERHTENMRVIANDRPGILSEVSSALAKLGVNVEELSTQCEPAPMSNEVLFKAWATLSIPDEVSDDTLANELEKLADDLVVEFDPD